MGDLILYDQENRDDTSYRPKDVSEPGMPPGNGGIDQSRDDMDGSSAKVIPDHLKIVARYKRLASYDPTSHYYRLEPRTPVETVIERWQNHTPRQKALDDSMPQDFPLRDLWELREYTWTRENSRPGYAKVEGESVYLPGPLKWDALEEDLRQRGWDERDPLLLEIGSKGGVKVGEGNHRLAIARGLGLQKVPVRFIFSTGTVTKSPQFEDPEPEIPSRAVEEAVEKIPKRELNPEEQAQVDELLELIMGGKFASRTAGHPRGRTIDDILSHVDPKVRGRSTGISVKPLRFDPDQGFWSWSVVGSKGERYLVRIKGWGRSAKGKGDLAKTPIRCSCTCNFWRWQGPEHWAKVNGYLYRTWRALPLGTMSYPHIRDPQGKHWACKHLVAVLQKARKFKFASDLDLSLRGRLVQFGSEPSAIAVAQRFARAGDARQTAISLLRDAPDEDLAELIEMARQTPELYDEVARDFVPGEEVAEWLERLAPKPHPHPEGFKVYHATSPQAAKLLLRRGFIPETKPRGIGEYAPGKGLEAGLYVGATPRAVESYGRVVLEVSVPKRFLSVPQELAQLGESDPMRALHSHDGAVINHTIPASSFQIVEGAHYLRG